MTKIKASDGFRFLPLPYAKPLQDEYLPALLTNKDYPGMVPPGDGVETVAVSAVMIAYNWPKGSDRYRRIDKFVQQFFPRLADFQKPPRHPKWRETNLAATLPGWTRFAGADEWLRQHRPRRAADGRGARNFKEFLAKRQARRGGRSRAAVSGIPEVEPVARAPLTGRIAINSDT